MGLNQLHAAPLVLWSFLLRFLITYGTAGARKPNQFSSLPKKILWPETSSFWGHKTTIKAIEPTAHRMERAAKQVRSTEAKRTPRLRRSKPEQPGFAPSKNYFINNFSSCSFSSASTGESVLMSRARTVLWCIPFYHQPAEKTILFKRSCKPDWIFIRLNGFLHFYFCHQIAYSGWREIFGFLDRPIDFAINSGKSWMMYSFLKMGMVCPR